MTGVLNALVGRSHSVTFSAILADTGTGIGVDDPAGSISPTSFNGAVIQFIQSTSSPSRFDFRLDADVAQSFFAELIVEVTAGGSYKTFRSADATFDTTGANQTTWRWSTSSDGTAGGDVWSGGIGLTRRVLIRY